MKNEQRQTGQIDVQDKSWTQDEKRLGDDLPTANSERAYSRFHD
jgi:hypothetical protein